MAIDFSSAPAIVQSYLEQYGLGSMASWALSVVAENPNLDEATFSAMLYERPEFKAVYPAFDALRQDGRGISVAAYREYTETVRNTLDQWGIPQEMYGSTDSIADMLIKRVSPSEVNYRIQKAAEGAFSAPEETRNALRDMYGVDSGGMIAYWLDPDLAQPILERQWAAAQVTGAASRSQVAIERQEAERLAALGITEAQAQAGFQDVASMRGLTGGGGETVSQDDLVGAAFGTDAKATEKVQRVVKTRTGQFQGGGGAADSQAGITGLGSTTR